VTALVLAYWIIGGLAATSAVAAVIGVVVDRTFTAAQRAACAVCRRAS
jgi:hypothetical protein